MYDQFRESPFLFLQKVNCEFTVILEGGVTRKVKVSDYEPGKLKKVEVNFNPPVTTDKVRIQVDAQIFPPSNALESIKKVNVYEDIGLLSRGKLDLS